MKVLNLFPRRIAGAAALMFATALSSGALLNAQGAGPVLTALPPAGPNVVFTWSAVPTATSYVVQAGLAPGQYALTLNVGNTTTFAAQAPVIGTYFVRVQAVTPGGNLPSNEVSIQVLSLFVPPAAPTNLTGYLNGLSALLTWELGQGGGTPAGLLLFAGTTPGASDVGIFPLPVGTQLSVPVLPAGTYYMRVAAVNQGGRSLSNEFELVMPNGGGCSAPPARTMVSTIFGRYLQLDWQGVPGAAGYKLDFAVTPGGPAAYTAFSGPSRTRIAVSGAPLGTFYSRLTASFACGSQTQGPEVTLNIDGAPPPGPRADNPPAGRLLGFPSWGASVVNQLAAERPDLLRNSCVEHGGNNRFMFEAVRRLRAQDNRFGLNWKRGNVGDLSQDIVTYNASSESDEGTRSPNIYIIDMIGGHCGSNPSPNWGDVTQVTAERGTIGIWTLMPYLAAGYPIVSDQPQQ